MIELTRTVDDTTILVNPELIERIDPAGEGSTLIFTSGVAVGVNQSPANIAETIHFATLITGP